MAERLTSYLAHDPASFAEGAFDSPQIDFIGVGPVHAADDVVRLCISGCADGLFTG
jgi:hypothetical protein